jgi:isopenicillin N synthase-like dioxygenase
VLNVSGAHHYSIAFFFGTALDSVTKCVPSCVSADNPARYRPACYRDLIHDFYWGSHFRGGDHDSETV